MRRKIARFGVFAFAASVMAIGCATGSALRNLSPIQPLAKYEDPFADVVVDTNTRPDPTLELTKQNITVRAQYWRKYDLDRNFNKGTSGSPFLSEPTWKQGYQVDIWWVSIENKRKKPLRAKLSNFQIEDNLRLRPDMDGNIYLTLTAAENRRRLYEKKGQKLDITRGLEEIKPKLFETHIPVGEIAPGQKAEGFVPFYKIKPNALYLELTIAVEAATEGAGVERYQKVEFVFPYQFDRNIFAAQPATVRF